MKADTDTVCFLSTPLCATEAGRFLCVPPAAETARLCAGRSRIWCVLLPRNVNFSTVPAPGRVRPANSGLGGGGTRRSHREEPPPRGPSLSGRRGPAFLLPLSCCYCDSFDYMHFTAGGGMEGNIMRPCYQKKKKEEIGKRKKERERKEGEKRKKNNF